MFMEQEYIRLRAKLAISQMALGEELMTQPQLLMETLEFVVQAHSREQELAQTHKTAISIAQAELRELSIAGQGKKLAETVITAEAPLMEEPQAILRDWLDAKADLSYWQGLSESMRARLSVMKRMSDLTVAGYMMTGSAYHPEARAELAEARRAKAPLPRVRP